MIMKPSEAPLPITREIATRLLPPCHCRQSPSGNWPSNAGEGWLLVKPEDAEPQDPPIIEYQCLTCRRRYRLRGPKFCEVLPDGSERAYMREGRYGRWLSCR
jgi:hypothetical protein